MSDFVETELGNLPKEWIVTTVEELVQEEVLAKPLDGNHGNIHPKGTDFVNKGIPFIMASDVTNGKVDLVNCKFISKEQADSLQKGFSKTGDVLLTHKASLGRTAIVQENFYPYIMLTPQVTYYRILNSDSLNNKYLKYYFDSPVFQDTLLNHGDSGSTRSYVGITAQRELPIIYPPIDVQLSISQLLGGLDDKIDLLHRQNQTLEEMAETLFRQWFVEEADESWEIKKLKELVDIGIGRTPPRKEFHWFSKSIEDIKWVSIKDLADSGVFVLDTSEYLTEEAVEKFKIPIIPPNTVLLSFKMTLGRVAITTEHMLSNEAIAHFKFNKKTPFSKEFLYYYLKTYPYETLGSTSSIVTSINSGMIKDMDITIPNNELLRKFEGLVMVNFNKISSNQIQIRILSAMRDILLPKLMSGEVRVEMK